MFMRYHELTKNREKRQKQLKHKAEEKADLWALMYADFDYINRRQSHLLADIENKLAELSILKNEFELMIDKAEMDHTAKEHIRKLANQHIQKVMKG